jgi:hypothetical protein
MYINDLGIMVPVYDNSYKKSDFQGSAYFNVIVMYFLSHKHDNSCVIFNEPYSKNIKNHPPLFYKNHTHDNTCVLLPNNIHDIPNNQTDVSLRWVQEGSTKKGYISVPNPTDMFWANFKKCYNNNCSEEKGCTDVKTRKRFIVLPFGYNCDDSGHANYLIYDIDKRILERFESYGKQANSSTCINPKDLDKKILKLFTDNLGKDFVTKYRVLKNHNFQTIQENEKQMSTKNDPVGFCSIWCAWFIDLKLSNPNTDTDILLDKALNILKKLKKEHKLSFTSFIRNYSKLIVDVSNEIKLMYE